MQVAFFCCFRQGVAGISRDLGRDIPDLEKLYARKRWADFSYPIIVKSIPPQLQRIQAKPPIRMKVTINQQTYHLDIHAIVAENSRKGWPFRPKKAHKHKRFGPVALGTTPGNSRGQSGFVPVPGTKPGFLLLLHNGSQSCPRDKPSLSLGQSRGRAMVKGWKTGGTNVRERPPGFIQLVLTVLVFWSLGLLVARLRASSRSLR